MLGRYVLAVSLFFLLGAAHGADQGVSTICASSTSGSDKIHQTTHLAADAFEVLAGDVEVRDNRYGLIWQRCPYGFNYNTQTLKCDPDNVNFPNQSWKQSLEIVEALNNGWRLPNIKELASIVERKCFTPALNLLIFPVVNLGDGDSVAATYWSATPRSAGDIWALNFNTGTMTSANQLTSLKVRLVKDAP